MIAGYTRIAAVNLTEKRVSTDEVSEELAYGFVGGRGWAARMLLDVPRHVGAFHPDNPLIIAAGPLTLSGRPPFGSKIVFAAVSPASDSYGDSNVGGFFGLRMRRAGFDALVIRGSSDIPAYLLVGDSGAEICDARKLWGKGSRAVDKELRGQYGEDFSVASIGPAGERKVRFACVNIDWDRKKTRHGQAGRTGIGAVMGSKNLKAIVVAGNREIPIADPARLEEVCKRAGRLLVEKPAMPMKKWLEEGTMTTMDWSNTVETLPTFNFQRSSFDMEEKINADAMQQKCVSLRACSSCSTPCEHVSRSRGAEELHSAVEYESAALLGSNLGLDNFDELIRANYLCDDLGIDTISSGVVIGFVMEAFEKGLIPFEKLGFKAKFGDAEAVYRMIKMIANRDGFGDTMAEGVKALAASVGKESQKFTMQVKGLEISGYDHRAATAMALSYATCDIGAHHNRAWAITYDVKGDRTSYSDDKVDYVIYLQHLRPIFDMLGVCRFQWIELGLDPTLYAEAYSAVVGKEFTMQDLLWRSERVWNLTRTIRAMRGEVGIDGDMLPERDFTDPVPEGSTKGARLDKEKFRDMLRRYYSKRGWTPDGRPTKEKLVELGLEEAANALYG